MAIGRMNAIDPAFQLSPGTAFKPSTAERTEIAGVINASP